MQNRTTRTIADELTNLIKAIRENNLADLDALIKQYQLNTGTCSIETCLEIFRHNLPRLEQLRTSVASHASEQYVREFLQPFINPFITPTDGDNREIQAYNSDLIANSVIAVNEALDLNDPMNTLSALRPFLREQTMKSLDTHRIQGSINLIASLYHMELGAAREDKGCALTQDELFAASDVLACVVQLNEAIDRHDPLAVYTALLAPDAFWEDVHLELQKSERDQWGRFYFQRLCRVRDQKSIAGRLPILTHAEIQTVISLYKSARLDSHETNSSSPPAPRMPENLTSDKPSGGGTSVRLNSPPNAVNSATEPASNCIRSVDIVLQNLSQNSPLLTLENLLALQRDGLFSEYHLDPKLADLYHSFLYFHSHHSKHQIVNSISTIANSGGSLCALDIHQSIGQTDRLQMRMLQLGKLLMELNEAIKRNNGEQIFRCLQNNLMYTELGVLEKQTTNTRPNPAYREAYQVALVELRTSRINAYQQQHNDYKSSPSTDQPRLSLLSAYLEKICSLKLGSGWLWTYVSALSPSDTHPILGTGADRILLRSKIPYFFNTDTAELVRWPFNPKTQTCVWTENLSQIRWPPGYQKPPCLDPSVLNREDCILIVSQINKLMELRSPALGHSIRIFPTITWSALCQATGTLMESHLPPERFVTRREEQQEQLARIVRCIIRIQSYWRGYRVRKQYRLRAQFYSDPAVQNAAVCLQKHWRRHNAQQKLPELRYFQRRRISEIIRLQSAWRGAQTRLFLRRLYLLALNKQCVDRYNCNFAKKTMANAHLPDSSPQSLPETTTTTRLTKTRPAEPSTVATIVKNEPSSTSETPDKLPDPSTKAVDHSDRQERGLVDCLSPYVQLLEGRAAKSGYEQEVEAFLLGKQIVASINRLVELHKELASSDQLIKLLIHARLVGGRAMLSVGTETSGQSSIPAMEIQTSGHNSTVITLPDQMIRLYGHVCYLCYTQPEYMANLICAIPNAMLWKFSVIPHTSGFCHFRPNLYGLSIERLIFGLYRYAATEADEMRLIHLLTRCLHKEVYQLRASANDDTISSNTQRWFAESEPWPFVFRLAVSLARLKNNQGCVQAKVDKRTGGVTFRRLEISSDGTDQNSDSESQVSTDRAKFQTQMTQLRMLLVDLVQHIQLTSRKQRKRSLSFTSHETRKHTSSVKTWLIRTKSALTLHRYNSADPNDTPKDMFRISPSSMSTESAPIRSGFPTFQTESDSSTMEQMIHAATRFFHGIFVQPGAAALPDCLIQIMRESYRTLRHVFPEHPEKVHLKFVGHCLLHRYLHSCLIAPDVLLSTYASLCHTEDANEFEHSESDLFTRSSFFRRGAHGDGKNGRVRKSNTQTCPITPVLSNQHRRILAAISRLLYFVIANKGYGADRSIGSNVQVNLTELLNPLIRKSHAQFRQFMSNWVCSTNSRLVSDHGGERNATDSRSASLNLWLSSIPMINGDDSVEPITVKSRDEVRRRETHYVVLGASELFEFHRLLIVHRNTVAPHGSDVLHTLLDALGSAPAVFDSTASDQSVVDGDLHNTSAVSGVQINGGIGVTHDIDADTDPDGDDESRSSGVHVGFTDSFRQSGKPSDQLLRRTTRSMSNVNVFTHSVPSIWANELPKLFSQTVNCLFHVRWSRQGQLDSSEYFITGSQEIVLPLRPSSRVALWQARLYAALAACLRATDCMPFPLRACHSSACLRDPGERMCRFCLSTNNMDWYNVTASLTASGGNISDNQTTMSRMFDTGELHRSVSFGCLSNGESDPVKEVNSARPETVIGFQRDQNGRSENDNKHFGYSRTGVGFDWICARRILIELFRVARELASRSAKLHIPTHCTLKKWIENLEQLSQKSAQLPDSHDHQHCSLSTKQLVLPSILKDKHSWIKRLHRLLDQFRLVSGRLEQQKFLNAENEYQELLQALARDICHLRAPCRRQYWTIAIRRLHSIQNELTLELDKVDQQATIYAAHALDCLVPLDRERNVLGDSYLWMSRPRAGSPYVLKLSANRLRKRQLISNGHQLQGWHNLSVYIEPTTERSVAPNTNELSVPLINRQYDKKSSLGRKCHQKPRFIPGMFNIRLFASNVHVCSKSVSLVDLLCQHHRGVSHLAITAHLTFSLEHFIQLLLDTYYTVRT